MTFNPATPPSHRQLSELAARHEKNGASTRAARLYRLAARQALRVGNREQALELLNSAIALTADSSLNERYELLLSREEILGQQGRTAEQAQDLASLESLAAQLDNDARRAVVATRLARWRMATGDFAAAASLAGLAIRLAELSAAAEAQAAAQLMLGQALQNLGDYPGAQRRLEKGIALAKAAGDSATEADGWRLLGILDNEKGEFDRALQDYSRAAALYEADGNLHGLAHVRNNLGHVHAVRSEVNAAEAVWREAQALFEEIGDREGSVRVLVNRGALGNDLGQYERVRELSTRALEEARAIKSRPAKCYAHLNLGLTAHYQDRQDEAVAQLREAQAIAVEMGGRRLEGYILVVLGHALAGQGQIATAGDVYWEALAIWEELGLPNLAAEAQAGLARVALAAGTPSLAMWFVEAILAQAAVDEKLEGTESPVRIYLTCYQVLAQNNDPRASQVLDTGQRVLNARTAGLPDDAARAMRENVLAHRELLSAALAASAAAAEPASR